MKLKVKPQFKIYRLQVDGSTKRFIIDRKYAKEVSSYSWRFVPRSKGARATIVPKEPRVFLHRFIAHLADLEWKEYFFDNGDPYDCREGNLRPYRRDEEGANRKPFKNKSVKQKGVFLKKGAKRNKYGAAIRVKGKLTHLGYFADANQAAKAYMKAFREKHPV